MKKIESIIIKVIPDYDTDLSYLGEFSNEKGEFAIEHSDNPRQYKYFNADNVENIKQARKNYNRIMDYEKGNLTDYGIKAEAVIKTSLDNYFPKGHWLIHKISSGGLWGMPSDGTMAEFKYEAENQLDELLNVLKEFGFTDADIEAVKVDWSELDNI